jgi:hypothetical protein
VESETKCRFPAKQERKLEIPVPAAISLLGLESMTQTINPNI